MNGRKQLLQRIIEKSDLEKLAQEAIEQAPENEEVGQQIADQVFDKFLLELDI